jgi:hypothetical protein
MQRRQHMCPVELNRAVGLPLGKVQERNRPFVEDGLHGCRVLGGFGANDPAAADLVERVAWAARWISTGLAWSN